MPGTISRCTLLLLALTSACSHTMYRASFHKPEQRVDLDHGDPFLKAHTHNGEVYVLAGWRVNEKERVFEGKGIHYSAERQVVDKGELRVPFDRVALLETNQPEKVTPNVAQIAVMGVVTGASLAMTAVCIASPKTCFGSCPTFYASDGKRMALQAEGFSSSVARVLEETDVDALFTARPEGRRLTLRMTNEALETHAVRGVSLLVVPRPATPEGRVLRAGESFYPATVLQPPRSCRWEGGDCLPLVARIDRQELLSPTDEQDLAAKETVELSFDDLQGAKGLVIAARNSLVNTFLFYQILAYMGRTAGEWFAMLERGDATAHGVLKKMKLLLGDVEVSVLTRTRGWVRAGAFSELGPIAREVQLIPFPEDIPGKKIRVRLRMAKGYWKLDRVALAKLGSPLSPVRIAPFSVTRDGKADPAAQKHLSNPEAHLFTYPGDVYELHFRLPELTPGRTPELFLESRGFYYEWIRKQWLAEESAVEVLRIIADPGEFLRRMAPVYKRMEKRVERVFWESRIRKGW